MEVTGCTPVLALVALGKERKNHTAISLRVQFLARIAAIVELIVLHKDVGAVCHTSHILLGVVNESVINGEGLVFTVFIELVALDCDIGDIIEVVRPEKNYCDGD